MLERIRRSQPVTYARRALRDKTMRAMDEVVSRYYRQQSDQLDALRGEIAELRDRLRHDVEAVGEAVGAVGQAVDHAADRIMDHTTQTDIRAHRDIVAIGNAEAARESAEFVRDEMGAVRHFGHPHATLEYALSLAPEGGLALEFGVYSGTTLGIIAKYRDGSEVYGFDSFEGLPEDWRAAFPAGSFAVDTPPDVPGAELVVGWFADTLPAFLAEHDGSIDFLHVDADLYSAAVTVLDLVGPRLRPGSIVVFDEFFNYPGWRRHEYRAWQEHVARTGLLFEYVAYTYDNEQVALKVVGA